MINELGDVMRIIGLEEMDELLTMSDCIEVLDRAYKEFGNGRAINIPRQDMITPSGEKVHGLKTMSGSLPATKVAAVRINSDIIHWPEVNGTVRRVKVPAAPGGKWVGLVLLFSIETGEPLAIMPDGIIQRMRVGGTGGLGIDYLAKKDASKLALLGSGWQAGAAAMAACVVRDIKQINVYSPNPENRVNFARNISSQLGVEVIPTESAEEACKGADIVSCATNALGKVFDASWLEPGMHFVSVKKNEIDEQVYHQADRVVINTKHGKPDHYIIDGGNDQALRDQWLSKDQKLDLSVYPELKELVTGQIKGRQSDKDVTIFSNNLGLGFQFAAVGQHVLNLAIEQGKGNVVPTEWFLQNVHP